MSHKGSREREKYQKKVFYQKPMNINMLLRVCAQGVTAACNVLMADR